MNYILKTNVDVCKLLDQLGVPYKIEPMNYLIEGKFEKVEPLPQANTKLPYIKFRYK